MRIIATWEEIDIDLKEEDDIILSFCDPEREAALVLKYNKNQIVFARKVSQDVTDNALKDYQSAINDLGLFPLRGNKTVRSLFSSKSKGYTTWWFNPLNFRDCEVSDIYKHFLTVNIILSVAVEYRASSFVLLKEDPALHAVLSAHPLYGKERETIAQEKKFLIIRSLCRQFLIRTFVCLNALVNYFLLRNTGRKKVISGKVGLISFIDWGFVLSDKLEIVKDKYFGKLKERLIKDGVSEQYLLWFQPNTVPGKKYSRKALLKAIATRQDAAVLNRYISLRDIFLEYFYVFTDFFRTISAVRQINKTNGIVSGGLNVWPLLKQEFISGAVSYSTMENGLVFRAFRKALLGADPDMILFLFLEHFPFARAVSLAAHTGDNHHDVISMQHATNSKGKTFAYIDPVNEFDVSVVDSLQLPHPDRLIVMGEKNKPLYESFGYNGNDVILIGSCRYEELRVTQPDKKNQTIDEFVILLPLAIKQSVHEDLIQAVYQAVQDVPKVRIIIRNHPYWQIEKSSPWVAARTHTFTISDQSLADDLASAHVVISAYSTVAEEALLQGLPVIQWRGLDFEGSPLAYEDSIHTATTVGSLRELILDHIANYDKYLPDIDLQEKIYSNYFAPSAAASDNISRYLVEITGKTPMQ